VVDRPAAAMSPIVTVPPETVVAGWVVSARRSNAELTLIDQTPLTKVAVKAPWDGRLAETLGVRFGRTARSSWQFGASTSHVLLVGATPGEWLAMAAPGEHAVVVGWLEDAAARADELVSVVDITHGRALVRLAGTRAPALLAKECGVDLNDSVFPDASALRTSVSGVATDIVRDDRDGTCSYLLHCERSSGQYLFDSLLDAGREFGVEADGFRTPGI
jgi:heterotetrameric sarcosine oxidase gamma subunit